MNRFCSKPYLYEWVFETQLRDAFAVYVKAYFVRICQKTLTFG